MCVRPFNINHVYLVQRLARQALLGRFKLGVRVAGGVFTVGKAMCVYIGKVGGPLVRFVASQMATKRAAPCATAHKDQQSGNMTNRTPIGTGLNTWAQPSVAGS